MKYSDSEIYEILRFQILLPRLEKNMATNTAL